MYHTLLLTMLFAGLAGVVMAEAEFESDIRPTSAGDTRAHSWGFLDTTYRV